MAKKGLSYLLIISVLLSVIAIGITASAQAQAGRVYLEPQNSTVQPGGTTDLGIWVDATGFQGGQINLTYDPSVVNVTGFVNESGFPIWYWNSESDGEEWILFTANYSPDLPLSGNYRIGTLTVEGISLGTSELGFGDNSSLFNDRGNETVVDWVGGSVDVGEESVEIPVYFEPSKGTVPIGQEFTVNVTVGNETNPAYNVTSDEIAFEFNPAVLQVVSVTNGPYLASSGYSTFPMTPTIDNVNGTVTGATESISGSNVAPTGTGVIWTITFNATGTGTSYVNFTRVWLAEPPGMPEDVLPVTIINASFTVEMYGAIGGIVTEGDGVTPIEGAIVSITQNGNLINSTTTNTGGVYLMTELSAGLYNVTVSKTYGDRPSMNCASNRTTAVEIIAGETTVLDIKLRHIADMYWDGDVNMFDLNVLAGAWNTAEGDPGYRLIADLYPDGSINMFDLNIFAAEWGASYY